MIPAASWGMKSMTVSPEIQSHGSSQHSTACAQSRWFFRHQYGPVCRCCAPAEGSAALALNVISGPLRTQNYIQSVSTVLQERLRRRHLIYKCSKYEYCTVLDSYLTQTWINGLIFSCTYFCVPVPRRPTPHTRISYSYPFSHLPCTFVYPVT